MRPNDASRIHRAFYYAPSRRRIGVSVTVTLLQVAPEPDIYFRIVTIIVQTQAILPSGDEHALHANLLLISLRGRVGAARSRLADCMLVWLLQVEMRRAAGLRRNNFFINKYDPTDTL